MSSVRKISLLNVTRKQLTEKLTKLVDSKDWQNSVVYHFEFKDKTYFKLTPHATLRQPGNGLLEFQESSATWNSLKDKVTKPEFRDFFNSSEPIDFQYFKTNFCEVDFLLRFEIARRAEVTREDYL